jgi:hypothetical protein
MAGISPKQEKAIAALLATPNVARAALRAGIGERTLWRWLKADGDFQCEYRKARRLVFEHAIAELSSLASEAVAELRRILADKTARDRDKLRACHLVLAHARASSTGEVEDLFDKLEAALEAHGVSL